MSLISFIEDEESRADLESVESEREKALRYYQPNRPLGNEIEGRSQVVMRDTFDVIEAELPGLVSVFTSGEDVLTFNPNGPEDVQAAEQETDYVNHIIMQKNNGFMMFYDWIKDAELLKNGYVKIRVEDEEQEETKTYEGIDMETITMLLQEQEEIISAEPFVGPNGEQFFNIEIKPKEGGYKCIKLYVCRPESIKVSASHRAVSLQTTPFVSHEEMLSISALREVGLEVDDDIDDDASDDDEVDTVRREEDSWGEEDSDVPANRIVRVRDVWCRYDDDGDGISELIHVMVCGTTVLLKEPADCVPIAALTGIRLPHRHQGIATADLCIEIQDTNTTLLRTALDAQYLANHGRNAVNVNKVNLDDMLVSRPGGIVRTDGDPAGLIMPLVNPVTGNAAIQMIEYMNTVREGRTGVTRYNQGMDADSLNKTASGISQIMGASQQRSQLKARLMAETGVKELFMLVHKFSLEHMRKVEVVKLRNKWVPINPSAWKTRKDMTISVGDSTGNKQQQTFQMEKLLQFMAQGMQMGIVTKDNMYNGASKLIQAQGFKDVDSYVTNPANQPPQPPQEPPELVKAKMEIEADKQKFQAQSQLEQQKMQDDMAMKQQQAQLDMQLEQFKAQLKAETDLKIAQIEIAAKARIDEMNAMNQAQQNERDSQRNQQNEGTKLSLQVDGLDQIKAYQEESAKGMEEHRAQLDEQLKGALETLTAAINKPKKIKRDAKGRVEGVE